LAEARWGSGAPVRGWMLAGPDRTAAADCRRAAPLPLALTAVLISLAPLAGVPGAAAQVADEEYVEPLLNQALEAERTGVELPWRNPATGSSGIIVIERTFYRDPRTPCRDYRRTLERAGEPAIEVEGTGCRIAPGEWAIDEEAPASRAATPAPAAGPEPAPDEPPAPEPAHTEPAPPSCPTMSVTPVPCGRPPAVVDYTMPTRTRL
jgi:surface antigen